jgi:hypothetical protein
VLVEQPGPWGYDALASNRMPRAAAADLLQRARALDARLVLLRRPDDRTTQVVRGFVARTGPPDARSLSRFVVPSADALGRVDLESLLRGQTRYGGTAPGSDDGPLFLVCTNGRRDPCCAERGRSVFHALARVAGGSAWECSHIGGDRFAANVVWLPEGVYYGRVTAQDTPRIAAASTNHRIVLDLYRGRTHQPMPVQAAETHVRRSLDLDGVDDVLWSEWGTAEASPHRIETTFGLTTGRRVRVTVRVDRASPRPLTCHSERAGSPPVYVVESMDVDRF